MDTTLVNACIVYTLEKIFIFALPQSDCHPAKCKDDQKMITSHKKRIGVSMKRIGVLTSGGDAQGMNAALTP